MGAAQQSEYSLGDALIQITGKVAPGLNQALGDADSRIKKHMGNLMAMGQQVGAGLSVAGAGLMAFLGLSTQAAAESEKAQAQLAQVLKSTGGAAGLTADELNKMAESLSKVTPFEDDAITGAQSMLLTFTKIGKEVFPEATETVLNMSQALGQDLKSSSIQLGKALNDPLKGVTALQRVGVSFTEDQKKQIKTLVESGQTMKAQKLILAELATEFGGQAKAAGNTFTGQITILKNTFGNLQEMIGDAVIPVLQRFLGWVNPLVQKTMDWIGAHKELFQQIVKWSAVGAGIMTVVGPLLIALPSIVSALSKVSIGLKLMGGPISLVIGAVGLLYAAFKNNWFGIRDITLSVWKRLQEVFANWRGTLTNLGEWMKGAWETIKQTTVNAIQATVAYFKAWYQEHKATVDQFVANVQRVLVAVWERVKAAFVAAWGGIKAFWDQYGPAIQQGFGVLVDFIMISLDKLMQFWNAHWETIRDVLIAAWDTIADVVKAGWAVVSWVVDTGLKALTGDWEGAWGNIKDVLARVWEGIKGVLRAAIDGLKRMWSDFTAWLSNSIEKMLLKIPGAKTLTDVVGNLGGKIPGMATGGVSAGGLTFVGERGPELAFLPSGTRVASNSDSEAMMERAFSRALSKSGGAGGAGSITLNVHTNGDFTPEKCYQIVREGFKRLKSRRG